MKLNKIINFIAFQAIWLIAVIGAANDTLWPALIAIVIFCVWQLAPSRRHPNDIRLVVFALFAGLLLDSFWQASGLISFKLPLSLPLPTPLSLVAPAWILLLWVALALSINHSLAWLKKSIWMPILFGAIGAPLSYFAGNRLDALSYPEGLITINILLSISWAIVMYLFIKIEHLFPVSAQNNTQNST